MADASYGDIGTGAKFHTTHSAYVFRLRVETDGSSSLSAGASINSAIKARIFLKREDLVHGGAHETNQVLGQALLAKRMGKTQIIAETRAGQHGATAPACALLDLECVSKWEPRTCSASNRTSSE